MTRPASPTAAARDDAWFDTLYATHRVDVWAYIARRVPDVADDVTSETFSTAWTKRRHIPVGHELPWLYRTAANHISHARRSWSRRDALHTRVSATTPTALHDFSDDVAHHTDASRTINHVFSQLSTADADILRLWAWEELTTPEIAVALGIKPSTARARLSRARRRAHNIMTTTAPERDARQGDQR